MLTYTYRYDGSSNFGPNKRWAGFHSVAASWRFSEEKFFESLRNKGIITNGKLRIGWGQTGNSNIGGYKWGSAMSVMETALGVSYRPANIKNLDIKWETQEQINIGLDLNLFHDRVNLVFDWSSCLRSWVQAVTVLQPWQHLTETTVTLRTRASKLH